MSDIQSMADIQALVKGGFSEWGTLGDVAVKCNQVGNLLLFNYTPAAQYAARWNYFERVSRGLILDAATGEVVARPFDKFFNWGEGDRTSEAPIVSVTEKMDGSLGILYRDGDTLKIATRGSFDSEQARWATEWLNRRTHVSLPLIVSRRATLLFEIIYPGNRVVVDYGKTEGLVLLAIRDRNTGDYWQWEQVRDYGTEYGFDLPCHYDYSTVDHISTMQPHLTRNQEGWVVEFADGQRFKFKGAEYLRLHRLISGLSFKSTLEAYQAGIIGELRASLPDEFLKEVDQWEEEIKSTLAATLARIEELHGQAPKDTRKDFALWVRDNCPDMQPYLFARLDNKPLEPLIFRHAFKERAGELVG